MRKYLSIEIFPASMGVVMLALFKGICIQQNAIKNFLKLLGEFPCDNFLLIFRNFN
jgi:hypothetical protein